jgi:hypothetical protein
MILQVVSNFTIPSIWLLYCQDEKPWLFLKPLGIWVKNWMTAGTERVCRYRWTKTGLTIDMSERLWDWRYSLYSILYGSTVLMNIKWIIKNGSLNEKQKKICLCLWVILSIFSDGAAASGIFVHALWWWQTRDTEMVNYLSKMDHVLPVMYLFWNLFIYDHRNGSKWW